MFMNLRLKVRHELVIYLLNNAKHIVIYRQVNLKKSFTSAEIEKRLRNQASTIENYGTIGNKEEKQL